MGENKLCKFIVLKEVCKAISPCYIFFKNTYLGLNKTLNTLQTPVNENSHDNLNLLIKNSFKIQHINTF
jgi:hypothetical protein